MVDKIEDWKYSSFNEYLFNKPNLCNVELAKKFDLFIEKTFYKESYEIIRDDVYNIL